jgi:hypothetical protein
VYQFSKNGTNCKELTFVVAGAKVSSESIILKVAPRMNFGSILLGQKRDKINDGFANGLCHKNVQ